MTKSKLLILSLVAALCINFVGCTKGEKDSSKVNSGNEHNIGSNINLNTQEPTQPPTLETMKPNINDKEKPVLYGVTEKQFYVGEGISYLKGVFALDNLDEDVEIIVDRSNVKTDVPGEYEVTYTAKDDAGNETSITTTITLVAVSVSQDEIDSLAQAVLDEIITEDMTQVEKMWEIYKYVNSSMTYDGTSNKDDWRAEAKRGFTSGYGDCFTYFSMSDILLEKIGVERLKVNRVGGISNHYWHMVNVDGSWYHFDPCYRRPTWSAFLRTDAEMSAFADRISIEGYEYYTYDKTKYPVVSTETFEWDRDSYKDKR